MSIKIVKDKFVLRKPTLPVVSLSEGEEIANLLLDVLKMYPLGVGLSANQIGIQKRVSVVRLPGQSPLILMNPEIVEKSSEQVIYKEGCLSIPGKLVFVKRSQKISVQTMNHANVLTFAPEVVPVTPESINSDFELLKCVCVQHEIDHLFGKLITDDDVRFIPPPSRRTSAKYGRNDKVVIEKNGETRYLKYKKAEELIKNEEWRLM